MREDELPPSPLVRHPTPVLRLRQEEHQFADVLQAVTDLWSYAPTLPTPTPSAITRAKAVVLAIGPLTPGGPKRVVVAPSVRGGVVVTFPLGNGRDVTVAELNNHSSLLILGKGWTGKLQVEETTHPEAIARARALCRSDDE
ncbi:hypothetical protein Rctr197k_183 [Virus Rctr197k]|nr:hypothetical protein Rctr197k_183 [Virus Rctr197k]